MPLSEPMISMIQWCQSDGDALNLARLGQDPHESHDEALRRRLVAESRRASSICAAPELLAMTVLSSNEFELLFDAP